MCAVCEHGKHIKGFFVICRFPKNLTAIRHNGVGTDDDTVFTLICGIVFYL